MDDFVRRKASIKSVLICKICKKRCKNVTIIEEYCHGSPSPSPSSAPSSSNAKGKGKKGRRGKKKKETNNIFPPPPPSSPPPATDHHEEAATSSGTRVHPTWFTLVACDNQDVNMPASYIKRYLAKKLSIQNEDKVEVRMLGMPIYPASPLHHLTDLWLRATPITEKKIKIGNSAKDFVMVLKYARSQKP